MSDSLCNIQLFQRFCHDSLPFNICYLSMEDIFYLHSSIKLVLQCLLADMFSVLEVRPAKCVALPGAVKDKIIESLQNALEVEVAGNAVKDQVIERFKAELAAEKIARKSFIKLHPFV